MGPAPRRSPVLGRRAAGTRHRTDLDRGAARPDLTGTGHRDPGHLAHRRDRRDAALADATRLDRGVRRGDATTDPQCRCLARAHRSSTGGFRAAGSRGDAPRRDRDRHRSLFGSEHRPRVARDPAVHERQHLRSQGRHAPPSLCDGQHRRHPTRARRSTSSASASSRGSRCITTWGSSACSVSR